MESEYLVKTTKENRDKIKSLLSNLGRVTDRWPDGSFNFQCFDATDEDEMTTILEEQNIESELI